MRHELLLGARCLGYVRLARIGGCELAVAHGRGILPGECGAKVGDGLVDELGIVGAKQGLAEHDADEGLVGGEVDGLPKRRHRGGRIAALEQELPFDLVKIRPVGLGSDQRIDQGHGGPDARLPIGGDGAGILRGKRLVGLWIAIEQHLGGVEEAVELRLDQVVAELKLGRIDGIVIRART